MRMEEEGRRRRRRRAQRLEFGVPGGNVLRTRDASLSEILRSARLSSLPPASTFRPNRPRLGPQESCSFTDSSPASQQITPIGPRSCSFLPSSGHVDSFALMLVCRRTDRGWLWEGVRDGWCESWDEASVRR
ncbi:hypothetical protein SCHPADRAFT_548720 [Schizopora paradoxa]|uniref:Uncharacterized protein n=1 Tax=Schizopora paradoxa TaxID=27342 RepID=A0A0H2RD42_9AGAM|nr:hypothetical protein SCHPADRAFT_548720 [Schizopora paradoxa]